MEHFRQALLDFARAEAGNLHPADQRKRDAAVGVHGIRVAQGLFIEHLDAQHVADTDPIGDTGWARRRRGRLRRRRDGLCRDDQNEREKCVEHDQIANCHERNARRRT
jgi:hypothetical protein